MTFNTFVVKIRLQILLVIFYSCLFSAFILKLKWFKHSQVNPKLLIAIFLVKVAVAVAYGLIQWTYYGYGDTFVYFNSADKICSLIPTHFAEYLKLTFTPTITPLPPQLAEHFDGNLPLYDHPRKFMLVRVNAAIGLFSFGHYYVHSVFFAFISFIGTFSLFRVFSRSISYKSKWFLFSFFLTPSLLFWLSGVHKGAIVVFGLGIMLYSIQKLCYKLSLKHILLFLFACWLTLKTREYVFLIILPALVAFILTSVKPKYALLKYLIVYLFAGLFFFSGKHLHPTLDFPQKLTEMQDVFLTLKGRSNFEMKNLEPNLKGFVQLTPLALKNTLLRPSFSDNKSTLHTVAIVENYLLLLLFVMSIFFGSIKKITLTQRPLFYFCLFFSFSFLIIIGLTVTNLGALVRYEAIATLFLVAAAVIILDVEKIKTFLNRKKDK